MTLHVASFGGGVVLEGAADTRKIDEVLRADSVEIGPRGALVAASDVTDYTTLLDGRLVPIPWSRLWALLSAMPGFDQTKVLCVGEGVASDFPGNPYGPAYLLRSISRQNEGATTGTPQIVEPFVVVGNPPMAPSPEGIVVTGYPWPGVWTIPPGLPGPDIQVNVAFFNLGAREGFAPRSNPVFGLYVAVQIVGATSFGVQPIKNFNALGTGPLGDGVPMAGGGLDTGTMAQQLYFRGVIAYNNHGFGWGFDSADATNGDGPARIMFTNLGKPLKYGNDNIDVAGVDRLFTDSDAIVLGDAGEIVRGAIKIFGKLFFGTNRSLHFIAGYGRDSFLSDGATPVMKAFNIVGPWAMIEGPDKLLYGVSDQGLWNFGGEGLPSPLFQKLINFDGKSPGWWDLIWTDPTRALNAYPGRTNQDLVWTAVDWDRHQVLVGIPWCNASLGYGYGQDTVVIKYHVLTGGFTKQTFPNVQYTAAGYARREGQQRETRFMGTATNGQVTVQRYGYKAGPSISPVMPVSLPAMTLGWYVPFGPDGEGDVRRCYLTLAWEAASALPLVFDVTTTVDQKQVDAFALSIQDTPPGGTPGDYWLDTSQTEFSIGDAIATPTVPARGGFLLKTLASDGVTWNAIAGQGGEGLRVTVAIPLTRVVGTRVTVGLATRSAAGRFQLEGFGLNPGTGTADS